ncbi:hypothetical protein COCVIDRAFT_95361 [Bipolaris victoriae FI3]|uniref:Uncharacterized protein n=1 Tax=Bipolaris victoriae (strain FI3) TaxID=930091 RepID=W7EWX1_BIPV3|nr:hypothetical protein COCVIDRAFT_95361 [Bipolaris victoriae FI3]
MRRAACIALAHPPSTIHHPNPPPSLHLHTSHPSIHPFIHLISRLSTHTRTHPILQIPCHNQKPHNPFFFS